MYIFLKMQAGRYLSDSAEAQTDLSLLFAHVCCESFLTAVHTLFDNGICFSIFMNTFTKRITSGRKFH